MTVETIATPLSPSPSRPGWMSPLRGYGLPQLNRCYWKKVKMKTIATSASPSMPGWMSPLHGHRLPHSLRISARRQSRPNLIFRPLAVGGNFYQLRLLRLLEVGLHLEDCHGNIPQPLLAAPHSRRHHALGPPPNTYRATVSCQTRTKRCAVAIGLAYLYICCCSI